MRKNIPLKSRLLLLAIVSCTFGALLTVTGTALLLVLISAIFTTREPVFYLYINLLIAVVTFVILIIPAFLRRRKAR